MFKTALFDCAINEECSLVVLTEDGAFALFFRPHPGGFDSSRVPIPGICHPRQKKMLMRGSARGGGGGGAQLELTDALRICHTCDKEPD